jgi:hypothetical protein
MLCAENEAKVGWRVKRTPKARLPYLTAECRREDCQNVQADTYLRSDPRREA